MTKPRHQETHTNCYFVTTNTGGRVPLFSDPKIASCVIESLNFLREKGRFRLHDFVVMLDHLHLLLFLGPEVTLPSLMHSLKSYTAKVLNRKRGKEGRVWQDGYYSRGIRGLKDLEEKLQYLLENPLRKGLAEDLQGYAFSSANGRYPVDPW